MSADGIGGARTGMTFQAGDTVSVEEAHFTEAFVAVKTPAGWINVWARDNLAGRAVGVLFCTVDRHVK